MTRLQPQFYTSEDGAGMARRRSPRLHPQIRASAQGAGMARRRSPRLHPQIQASEDGVGMTRRIRRRRGKSPAESASLPDDDDLLREILLRLPPLPSSLPRASAVCRRWRGLVTDPRFLRQLCAHHRKPPFLGFFYRGPEGIVFTPVLDPPDRIPPQRFSLGRYSGGKRYNLLDCRHGLVLIQDRLRNEVVVCDPITGEQRLVSVPPEFKSVCVDGAVLCAAGDHGHVHGACHSSPFKVVLVSTFRTDSQCVACVYSLETGVWGNLISTEAPYEIFFVDDVPAALIGNRLYWSTGDHILVFDLDRQNQALISGPPVADDILDGSFQIIQAADGAIGYVVLSYPRLEMWQRNINGHGVATWVLWRTTEMHTILGLPSRHERLHVLFLGYDEDDVLFLCYVGCVYMVQLKSVRSRKLDGIPSAMSSYRPFKSFFALGTTIADGFNGAEMLNIG